MRLPMPSWAWDNARTEDWFVLVRVHTKDTRATMVYEDGSAIGVTGSWPRETGILATVRMRIAPPNAGWSFAISLGGLFH